MNVMPQRVVHCADALPWMRAQTPEAGRAVVTSMPDVSEVSLEFADWRAWFLEAARHVIDVLTPEGIAVFYQSDIKREESWVDKGAWIVRAAEDAGARVLFHKIVCRQRPDRLTVGRPGYSHLIAVSREARCPDDWPIPDVITDGGRQAWVRGMGVHTTAYAVRFVRDIGGATSVLDPFCGVGTVLAVANALGLDAVGVEKAPKRARQSKDLVVTRAELELPEARQTSPRAVAPATGAEAGAI